MKIKNVYLGLSKYVDVVPEFETEQQAFEFYKGVYLTKQLLIDRVNGRNRWFNTKKVNPLPVKVYIIQGYSIYG